MWTRTPSEVGGGPDHHPRPRACQCDAADAHTPSPSSSAGLRHAEEDVSTSPKPANPRGHCHPGSPMVFRLARRWALLAGIALLPALIGLVGGSTSGGAPPRPATFPARGGT